VDLLHDGVDQSAGLRQVRDAALHLFHGGIVPVDVHRVALDVVDVLLQLALRRTRGTPQLLHTATCGPLGPLSASKLSAWRCRNSTRPLRNSTCFSYPKTFLGDPAQSEVILETTVSHTKTARSNSRPICAGSGGGVVLVAVVIVVAAAAAEVAVDMN